MIKLTRVIGSNNVEDKFWVNPDHILYMGASSGSDDYHKSWIEVDAGKERLEFFRIKQHPDEIVSLIKDWKISCK